MVSIKLIMAPALKTWSALLLKCICVCRVFFFVFFLPPVIFELVKARVLKKKEFNFKGYYDDTLMELGSHYASRSLFSSYTRDYTKILGDGLHTVEDP